MYLAVSAKLILNLHDLNNERAEEIRRIPLIYELNDSYEFVEEAVAVSGVMLKHWHLAYMVALGKGRVNFCENCVKLEGVRVRSGEKGSESEFIKKCVGEDVHGFLRAQPVLRRESLIKFSWLLPCMLEEVYREIGTTTPFRVLQHSRNVRTPKEKRQEQMLYPRAYASGLYGFTSLVDLGNVGFSFTEQKQVLEKEEVKERRRLTVEAFAPMITGAFGASLARALPVAKPVEIICVVSSKPLPAPVHPIYNNSYELNVKLYKGIAELFGSTVTINVWGREVKEVKENFFKVRSVDEPAAVFTRVIEDLGLGAK